ncbi:MAG: caspase family protein, partial [Eubacteriales bacterium]|nr:caspase family protein [Eubacteriales bacterium]
MFDRLRRYLALWLTVCCLSAGFISPRIALGEADGRRVNRALLIGIDDFVSHPSSYPSSTNNVFAMQEALQASSVPFAAIMIPAAPVTDTQVLTELIRSTFGAADADDVNYLYISTHGEYDPASGTDAALLLSDGVTEGRLSPKALQSAFDGVAGKKVLLLDACYSGAFIGKGMRTQPEDVCFLGDDFKVLTSSGAMEESWYWSAAQDTETLEQQSQQGAFYFTQMLSQSLNPRYGSAA